eukprot:scaffold3.g6189.t1
MAGQRGQAPPRRQQQQWQRPSSTDGEERPRFAGARSSRPSAYKQQQQQQGGGGRRRSEQQQQQRWRPPRAAEAELPIPVIRADGSPAAATFFSSSSFAELGASPAVVEALAALGVRRPSHIQAAAYRALLSLPGGGPRHVLLADHAGSGKTLAYLLPHLQLLAAEEAAAGRPATRPRCPRLLIVVPTAELAAQALRVCRALAGGGLRFRSAAATGGRPVRTQREALMAGVDVLVGTPGRLLELAGAGALSLEACAAVVLDEVDVLLSGPLAFADQVRPLHTAAPPAARFVFVSATVPEELYLELEEEFPGLVGALGPGLHRTAPGITQQLVDCSGGDEVNEETGFARKAAALLALLRERRCPRTIVFANKIETCRKLENFLNRSLGREEGVRVLPHHAAIADARRDANLRAFLAAPAPAAAGDRPARGGGLPAAAREEQLVLVCTDRASRGLDSAYCDHVVLFDFPRDPSEYVRRVGRTARGGGSGTVTTLALGRQVKLAKDIIDRSDSGVPIHAVPAALPAVSSGGAS